MQYYVATYGSDSSSGGALSPWRSIRSALLAAKPGDSIYLSAGVFWETLNTNLYPFPSGNSFDEAIRVCAKPGEDVTVKASDGNQVLNLAAPVHHLIFDGITWDALETNPTNGNNVSLNGAYRCRFTSCRVINSQLDGVHITTEGGYHEFIGCEVHTAGRSGRGHCLYIESTDNLVDGCWVHDSPRYGVQIYTGYAGHRADRNTVRNSRFARLGFGELGGGAITLACGDANKAINNRIWNCLKGIEVVWGSPNDSLVECNSIYRMTGYGVEVGAEASRTTVRRNIAYLCPTPVGKLGTDTVEEGTWTSDPGFVSVLDGSEDLTLKADSPCRLLGIGAQDSGVTEPAPAPAPTPEPAPAPAPTTTTTTTTTTPKGKGRRKR